MFSKWMKHETDATVKCNCLTFNIVLKETIFENHLPREISFQSTTNKCSVRFLKMSILKKIFKELCSNTGVARTETLSRALRSSI